METPIRLEQASAIVYPEDLNKMSSVVALYNKTHLRKLHKQDRTYYILVGSEAQLREVLSALDQKKTGLLNVQTQGKV